MDPFTSNWTAAENKALNEALAEVDLNSSNWIEYLISRLPNRTTDELRDHILELVAEGQDEESGSLPNPIFEMPSAEMMPPQTEDLSAIVLPYFPQFFAAGSMCSGTGSTSEPRNKIGKEELLPEDMGESEENMRERFLFPENKGLIAKSSNEPAAEQKTLASGSQGLTEKTGIATDKRVTRELETPESRKRDRLENRNRWENFLIITISCNYS